MADLFAPQNILPFLKGPAEAVQGPANQGAIQQLLQNPQLLNAIKAITGQGGQAPQVAMNNAPGLLNSQAGQLLAQQLTQGLGNIAGQGQRLALGMGSQGPVHSGMPVVQNAARNLPAMVGQVAQKAAPVVQQATKAIPMGAQAGVNALPSMESALQNMISSRAGTMGQLADMGKNIASAGAIPMPSGVPQAASAAKSLLNPQNVGNAMNMMKNLGGTVLNAPLQGLAQSAQASGRMLPAVSPATLAGLPLPVILSNPVLLKAAIAAGLFAGTAYGGYKLGQGLAERNQRPSGLGDKVAGQAKLQDLISRAVGAQNTAANQEFALDMAGQTPAEQIEPVAELDPLVSEVEETPYEDLDAVEIESPDYSYLLNEGEGPTDPSVPGPVAQNPAPQGVSEALAPDLPSDDYTPTGNTYGYESILNDPSFSAEAMLAQPQAAPQEEKPSFFQELGGILKDAAPSIIEMLMMQQLSKPSGGKKSWLSGMTFGASDPTKSLAYQKYVADINERSQRRQYDYQMTRTLENEMAKKAYDADIALQKSANDFQINTIKNVQNAAMDLIKENKINWGAISNSPDFDYITKGLQTGDIDAVVKALEYSPDVKQTLENQGLAVWNAINDMKDEGDSEGAIAALNDPTNQSLMAILKLGPSMDTMYNQLIQTERDKLRIQANLQNTLIRESGSDRRTNAQLANSAKNREVSSRNADLAVDRLEETKRHNKAMENKKTGTTATGRVTRKTAKDGDITYSWLEDSLGNVLGDVSYSQKKRGVGGIELGPAEQGVLKPAEAKARNFNVGVLATDPLEEAEDLYEEDEAAAGDDYVVLDYNY